MNLFVFFLVLSIDTCYTTAETEEEEESDVPNCSHVRITTEEGQIDGFLRETTFGRKYAAFEGIPYAAPPVGRYRFEEPQPVHAWVGVWQANTIHKCLQYKHVLNPGEDPIVGEEDCLYLNVYSPHPDDTANLDVIVFIHGGAFMYNYAAAYGPKIIMDRHVVYVSFNYRLGPFGFLTTEDGAMPGNLGIKDQIMALKWVQKNIKYFGGNPNSVTLAGSSAGAASVQLLYLSPFSKGLFHRGIAQSGSALNPWALMKQGYEKTMKLASLLGCPSDFSKKAVDCIKDRPAAAIVEKVGHFLAWRYTPSAPFGPVADIWAEKPVFPNYPYFLMRDGKVHNYPFMISHVQSEGLCICSEFISNEKYLNEIDSNWTTLMPFILDYNATVDEAEKNYTSEAIRQYYMQGKPLTKATFPELVNLTSERMFIHDIQKAARYHAAAIRAPVYYYYFSYRGSRSNSEARSRSKTNFGASHGDDTSYVLDTGLGTQDDKNDLKMTNVMLDIWISFACESVPFLPNNLLWPPVSRMSYKYPLNYVEIKSPSQFEVLTSDNMGNGKFWSILPMRENENLYGLDREEL